MLCPYLSHYKGDGNFLKWCATYLVCELCRDLSNIGNLSLRRSNVA